MKNSYAKFCKNVKRGDVFMLRNKQPNIDWWYEGLFVFGKIVNQEMRELEVEQIYVRDTTGNRNHRNTSSSVEVFTQRDDGVTWEILRGENEDL